MKRDKTAQFLLAIHDKLFAEYGELHCPLTHDTAFHLLVSVILSAQCRDDRVNEVTVELFRQYPDAEAMSHATPEAVGKLIHSLGLWRNKAENLVKLSAILVERHHGEVPQSMEELTALPGVGRKSANVVLGNAFGIPGFPVDTHVQRLMKRWRVATESDTPEKIETKVCSRVPAKLWSNFSHLVITHGRRVCHARNPECEQCLLREECPAQKTFQKA